MKKNIITLVAISLSLSGSVVASIPNTNPPLSFPTIFTAGKW